MKRVEVILTQAIEEDFISLYEKACKDAGKKCKFTKLNDVMGQGNTSPKMGDPIWPQLNILFIIYCDEQDVQLVAGVMKELHAMYVGEGAAAFASDAEALV
ncbi:MAG: hypothetical protein K2H09_10315 [Treponemataceae bacterium]|nr:hypothetical protein [Treponemataceae bacterium]